MITQQNNFSFCAVFSALNRCVRRVLVRGFLGAAIALMFCHAAIALDINQANEAELDSVKGMGPSLSAKVIKARSQGPFKDWADLMQRVSGIRKNKAHQFSEHGLTINGQSFGAKP